MTTPTPTEDFTFPISSSAAFIDSPPLWRHVGPTQAASTSSASTSSSSSEEEEDQEREQLHSSHIHTNVAHHTLQRKSFSSMEGGNSDHHRLTETDENDKMDLLWEDFNEDPSNFAATSDCDPSEFGCVPTALNRSKAVTGGVRGGKAVIPQNKKLRVAVFAKVLKRLFLLQHQYVKKRSW